MDTETMRRILAEKAMGWHEERHGWHVEWWDDAEISWGLVENFRPWESWLQCGLVIDAMRERGWCCDGSFTNEGSVWCSWWRVVDGDVTDKSSYSGVGDTFTEAVCYVAAHALEAADEVS